MRSRASIMAQTHINQSMWIGFFLLLLSAFSLKCLINSLPSFDTWPPQQPLPSAHSWRTPPDPSSAPNKAIQSTLKTISGLVASLNGTLSKTCPECIYRVGENICIRTFYNDSDVTLLSLAGMFVVVVGAGGTAVFLTGVHEIAPKFMLRVMTWGLGFVDVVVGVVAFGFYVAPWYECALHVMYGMIIGLVVGIVMTEESQVEGWKREYAEAKAKVGKGEHEESQPGAPKNGPDVEKKIK